MRILTVLLALAVLPVTTHAEQVLLWPDGAPGAKGNAEIDQPALTVHLAPKWKNTGAAVVVNPGGGYRILAADHEGLQVARWLNSIGVNAFVLRYRLTPKYTRADALADAQRAIRWARSKADQLRLSPSRIGMMGFSAGGHLTSAAGTKFDPGDPHAKDPIDRVSSRPDFLVPVYAAISGELLGEGREAYGNTAADVTAQTPPAFLAHTHADGTVSPNHSILFYQALLEHGIPAELHIFSEGPHGTGLAPGDPDINQWPGLLERWLARQGFLTDAEKVEVSGQVLLDGKPLYWGWLTLLPQDARLPVATAYMGWKAEGKFQIKAEDGPAPGRYKVEVHRVSKDFSEQQSGAYSMRDAEVFEAEMVEIKPGMNELKVEVGSD